MSVKHWPLLSLSTHTADGASSVRYWPLLSLTTNVSAGSSFVSAWACGANQIITQRRGVMIKNTSGQKVGAQLVSASDGSAFTSAVTAYITLDAGTQAVGTVGSGACTHEGNGYHTYALAQAETNGDLVAITFVGSGAVPATLQIYTVAGDAFTRLGAPAGASVSADIAAVKSDSAAILDDTGTSGVVSVTGAVGSVTGNVGGNVVGSVGSLATQAKADINAEVDTALSDVGVTTTVTGRIDATVSSRASAASLATAQTDLDTLTGTDGATLATSQPNYAPATAASASAIEADTQDIQSRLPAALVSGRMSSDAVAISGSTTAADKLEAHATGVLSVIVGSGSTTTAVVLNATTGINGGAPSSTNDFYNGRVLVFITGALAGQATDITDYVGPTVTATVTALTGAPANGDTAVMV